MIVREEQLVDPLVVAPEARGIGKAVGQEHRLPLALVPHRQGEAVAVDPPHVAAYASGASVLERSSHRRSSA
jgi:hypothetical protein